MQESGVRATQFTILSQLMLRGEMPIGKLAGILGMERTTLTRNLTLLEQRKWISVKAGDDPRSRMIGIPPQGRGIVGRGFSPLSKAHGPGWQRLGGPGPGRRESLAFR